MCRALSCRVSCCLSMPLVYRCRDWAREWPHLCPPPNPRGKRAPGGPVCRPLSSLPEQEAWAAQRTQTCFLELWTLSLRIEKTKLNHTRKSLHTLILKQTGSCHGLFGQRDVYFLSLAPGTLASNRCKLLVCIEDPALSEVARQRGHRSREDVISAYKFMV